MNTAIITNRATDHEPSIGSPNPTGPSFPIGSPKPPGEWSRIDAGRRCKIVGRAARGFARDVDRWVQRLCSEQRTDPVETITAEILPLCAALKFIARRGPKILADRRLGGLGRPPWLLGVHQTVRRVPHGTVLILGTWNYPLFLVAAQTAAALAAGNRVWIKPAIGCRELTLAMRDTFVDAGVPADAIEVLGESVEDATAAIDAPVQLVVLTGSAGTAAAVMRRCSDTLTPLIAEASGCDAMVCLPNFDVDLAAKLLRFGLSLNSGATCIAPRRVYVPFDHYDEFVAAVRRELGDAPEMTVHPAARPATRSVIGSLAADRFLVGRPLDGDFADHGRMQPTVVRIDDPDEPAADCDVFAPISGIHRYDAAAGLQSLAAAVNTSRYGLAASIIGPRGDAVRLADRLEVGTVVINDLVVPTADPRVPFGGRRSSGFGVTRGREGLLAMTVPRVIATRRHGPMTHLRDRTVSDRTMLTTLTRWLYGR